MLPTRDPPQDRRPTQAEREELETNIPSKEKQRPEPRLFYPASSQLKRKAK